MKLGLNSIINQFQIDTFIVIPELFCFKVKIINYLLLNVTKRLD